MTLAWPDYLAENDGELRFSGSRLGAAEIVFFYNERGYSVEMLALEFPSVHLVALYKFIAFYLGHTGDVDAYLATEQEQLDLLRASSPHRVSLADMRKRLAARDRVALP